MKARHHAKKFTPPTEKVFHNMDKKRLARFKQALSKRRAAVSNRIKKMIEEGVATKEDFARERKQLVLIERYIYRTKGRLR